MPSQLPRAPPTPSRASATPSATPPRALVTPSGATPPRLHATHAALHCTPTLHACAPPRAPQQRRRTILAASLSLSPPRSPSRCRLARPVTAPCTIAAPCPP
ncbi:hypothetical protein DENSPDRAFT_844541 [Dentipellis sp. KUC8613]|nr:hypothetical protein DENSPDRAFT_844541 [Dentipellis sp. KUC8613]